MTKQEEKYKKAYYLLMDYWQYIPDNKKFELSKKLEEMGV